MPGPKPALENTVELPTDLLCEIRDLLRAEHMTPEQWKCAHCGGEFLGGEPPHEVTVHKDGRTEILLYCIDCIDYLSEACWNDEEWGPYPSRLQHRRGQKGSA
jgi:hypothetical protein